jgi:hypothetical protein
VEARRSAFAILGTQCAVQLAVGIEVVVVPVVFMLIVHLLHGVGVLEAEVL